MFRHVKDKFGNSLLLQQHHLVSSRFSGDSTKFDEDHIDVKNKRFRFVGDPLEEEDGVNRRYLERFYVKKENYESLEERVKKLEETIKNCLQLDAATQSVWDAKDKKIINVKPGDTVGDVATFEQPYNLPLEETKLIPQGV